MTANELRSKFLEFFKSKGHAIIPSASLIPENDPSVLFTTAGMHPLVPFIMGEPHPAGNRLADAQKCVRTGDIEEVGDNRHLTFFEMLGNWSLGDPSSPDGVGAGYFKKEAIEWSFEFCTDKRWLGMDPSRIFVTVFKGNDQVPRDEEAIEIWKNQFAKIGIDATVADPDYPDASQGHKIYLYEETNWWGPPGITGPCGPDTEIYFDTLREHNSKFGEKCHPSCDCGRFIEIWNNVFMQYEKTADGSFIQLKQKNVDTGMGLERTTAILQGKSNAFETEIFKPMFEQIESLSGKKYGESEEISRSIRIIADHLRAATFILGDPAGIVPSNVDQGYILRRLIRRAIRHARAIGILNVFTKSIAEIVIVQMRGAYPELEDHKQKITTELENEEVKFSKTIERGIKEFEKMFAERGMISGQDAFILYTTYGFPLELTEELARDKGQVIDRDSFKIEFSKHQELSRAGATEKFSGGLLDNSEECKALHTATHLLQQALRTVLGDHVKQKGSNITRERLRFDFFHDKKMTPDEISAVEAIVNKAISDNLQVRFEILDIEKAKESGAIGLFEEKYAALGGKVKVYFVGDDGKGAYFSKEVCGGPHVDNTGTLGTFKIAKEEAVSSGIRRIKAVLS